jgi:hypothetical protein
MNTTYIILMIFILIIFFRFMSIAEKGKLSLENFDLGLLTKKSRIIGMYFVMVWIVYYIIILILIHL